MIAKHVPMKSVKKSDFASLASYISDEQEKDERVIFTTVTNCHSDDITSAIVEVTNVQSMNSRAESDKTYHLIVSFRAGERPSDDVLTRVESEICDGLGFSEHQRISAVHHDTDNLHIHIAINKIHPTKCTIHTPYYDHKVLSRLCSELEKKYGLEVDNHVARRVGSENRAMDIEHHAGVESLLGWIKRECLEQLRAATSWTDMHRILAVHGLYLVERGNGLIISTADGIAVKASSVARDLSKHKLENCLGHFEVSECTDKIERMRTYTQRPLRTRFDTTLLFSQYQNEQRHDREARTRELALLRQKRDRQYATVKSTSKLKHAAIKLADGNRHEKRLSHSLISRSVKKELDEIREAYKFDRDRILTKYRFLQWADWLRKKAMQGDREALAALRGRVNSDRLPRNTIEAESARAVSNTPSLIQDNVTKKGTIIYRAGNTAVRDDGKKLAISRGASTDGLVAALQIAMARYGNRITVNGTKEFAAQIVQAAVSAKLKITFSNLDLEQQRRSLQSATHKENKNESSQSRRSRVNGRADIIRSANTIRSYRSAGGSQFIRHNEQGTSRAIKSNIGSIGTAPPPSAIHCLRNLSDVPMVRIDNGSKVLLPSDVRHHVEQQGAESNYSLRRSLFWDGLEAATFEAAMKYVDERNKKRLSIIDISKHRLYNDDVGNALFAGIRHVDGHTLALLRCDSDIVVMPITRVVADRLKRLLLGAELVIEKNGVIKKRRGIRR